MKIARTAWAAAILLGSCGRGTEEEAGTGLEIREAHIRDDGDSTLLVSDIRIRVDRGVRVELQREGDSYRRVLIEGQPLAIEGGVLRVGGRSYGTVLAGDEVAFLPGEVRVNGERR